MPRPSRTPATPKRLKQQKLDSLLSSSPSAPEPGPSKSRRKPRNDKLDREGDASTAAASRPQRARRKLAKLPAEEEDGSQSSDAGAIRFEPTVIEVSDSEAESAPRPPRASPRKTRKIRADSEDEAVERDAVGAGSSSDVEEVPAVWRGKKNTVKRKVVVVDSDDDKPVEPKRRRLVKGERPPTPEEDEDLMDEVDEERIMDSRLRTRDKRTAFQKNLEKLKRKKRGEAVQSDSEESEGESSEEDSSAPFAGARPDDGSSGPADEQEGEFEDSFIVADENSVLVELPPEFSMSTFQDLIHHFKTVCQYFVHVAVQEPSMRAAAAQKLLEREQTFRVALNIVRRKIDGLKDSLVASSTWRPDFVKALKTYPHFETVTLEYVVPRCDACHLGGRKSTIEGRVTGEPYDKQTYETIKKGKNASASSDEDDSDEEDEDEDEESAKPEGESEIRHRWDLGRFCARRTSVYHKFTHWEYALFHALDDEVQALKASQSGRSFVRVAYPQGKQPPKDLKDADAIMEWLDERQVINVQWHEFKTMMDSARHLEMRGARGGDDVDD